MIENQHYQKSNQPEQLEKVEYENCSFTGCDFKDQDLSGIKFIECTFTECNLSMVKLGSSSFRDAVFKSCRMWGMRFDHCAQFGLSFHFENCALNYSSFHEVSARKTKFVQCSIVEVDFSSADLTSALFDRCDLERSIFENTNLEKTDFRTAFNYSLDPDRNKLKKTMFSVHGLPGLLRKYDVVIE